MRTVEEIQSQITAIAGMEHHMVLKKEEVHELPRLLAADEEVKHAVIGMYDKGNGLLVATNKRLLFVEKTKPAVKVAAFPLKELAFVQHDNSFATGKIVIASRQQTAEVQYVVKEQARQFDACVQTLLKQH